MARRLVISLGGGPRGRGRRTAGRPVAALLLMLAAAAPPAHGWVFRVKNGGAQARPGAQAMRVAANGDLIVAGSARDKFVVARVDADSGKPRWLHEWAAIGAYFPPARLALDASGDVYVGGICSSSEVFQFHKVLKLDGETGAELWAQDVPWQCLSWSELLVDGSGGVVVAEYRNVVRLATTDGARVWTTTTGGLSYTNFRGFALALDGAGGVVFGATVNNGGPTRDDVLVTRLALADGSETWRVEADLGSPPGYEEDAFSDLAVAGGEVSIIGNPGTVYPASIVSRRAVADGSLLWEEPVPFSVHSLAVDGAHDIVATGGYDGFVVKLRGSDGFPLWTTRVPSPLRGGDYTQFRDVMTDAAGDVTVAGDSGYTGFRGSYFVTARLDGATGSLDQVLSLVKRFEYLAASGSASAVAVDAAGAHVAAGTVLGDLVLLRADTRLRGRRLDLTDPAPDRRRLRLTVRDNLILAPAVGSADDPTIGGATLQITNPATLETATVPLPAAGWEFRPPRVTGGHGWRYNDDGALGPCSQVGVRGGKQIVATCAGPGLPFTLDEASQGQLDVRLTFSPTGTRWCMSFGGVVRDAPGVFSARNAPAPATCPPG